MLDTAEGFNRSAVSSFDFVCVVERTSKTVVFDVELPAPLSGIKLHHAILFEVENYVPFPLENIYWGYRKYPGENCKFRVFAVLKDEVDVLYQKIFEAGFKFDCFIPQQLLIQPDKPLSHCWEYIGGRIGENNSGMTEMQTPLQSFLEILGMDPSFDRLYLDACAVPKNMQPIRHRVMKFVNAILLLAAVVLCVYVLWNQFSSYSRKMDCLKRTNNELQQKADQLRNEANQLRYRKNVQDKVAELQLFGTYVLPVISDLNMRLPDHMYVTSYIQDTDSVEVTIHSTMDDSNLPRILMESKLYQADLRKTVQPDTKQTTYIVTLRGVKKW